MGGLTDDLTSLSTWPATAADQSSFSRQTLPQSPISIFQSIIPQYSTHITTYVPVRSTQPDSFLTSLALITTNLFQSMTVSGGYQFTRSSRRNTRISSSDGRSVMSASFP
jgi:hypothetical protein